MASTYETFKGLAYKSALIDSFNKTSRDLMAVDQAKQKAKQDKELHDLNKKKLSTELEILNRAGKLDDAQYQVNKKILANESNIINKKLENQNLQIEQTNQRLKGDLSSIVSQAKSLAVISQFTGTSLKSDAQGNITFEASQPTAVDAAKNRTAMLTELEKQLLAGNISQEQYYQAAQQYAPQQPSLRAQSLFQGEQEQPVENEPTQGQPSMRQTAPTTTAQKEDMIKKSSDVNALGIEEGSKFISQSAIEAEKAAGVTGKERAERKIAFTKANLMLLRSQENFTNMINEQKRINPNFKAGRFGGLQLWLSGKLGSNKYVRAFQGDLVTTAISLAKIAAPSAKVGPTFEKMLERTLNNIWSTPQESTEQLVQSMTDAFENNMSAAPQDFLTLEQMDLSAQEQLRILRQKSQAYKEDMRGMLDNIFQGTEGLQEEETIEETPETNATPEIDAATQFDQLYSQYTGGK